VGGSIDCTDTDTLAEEVEKLQFKNVEQGIQRQKNEITSNFIRLVIYFSIVSTIYLLLRHVLNNHIIPHCHYDTICYRKISSKICRYFYNLEFKEVGM
jgi:hypothetical protein